MAQEIDFSKIYSPYKFSMFQSCPKAYYFYYLDPIYKNVKNKLKNMPENIWPFNTLGKAVHNAITLFYHLPVEERTIENLKAKLKEGWISEAMWNKRPPLLQWGGFNDIDEEREVYKEAILMLVNFFKMADLNPELEFLPTDDLRHSIEDYKKFITPVADEFDISGKFDLVIGNSDGTLEVIDFKTGKKEESGLFQLRFYKVLAELHFKKPVREVCLYFLRTGNKKVYDLPQNNNEETLKEIKEMVFEITDMKSFETRPSKLCKYCLFKINCPDKKKVSEIIGDTVQEEDAPDDLPF